MLHASSEQTAALGLHSCELNPHCILMIQYTVCSANISSAVETRNRQQSIYNFIMLVILNRHTNDDSALCNDTLSPPAAFWEKSLHQSFCIANTDKEKL